MKFPLAYSIKNGLNGLCKTVSTVPCRVFAVAKGKENPVKYTTPVATQARKMLTISKSQSLSRTKQLKFPSPHDLGLHHVLKPFRPLMAPLVDTFAQVHEIHMCK